MLYLALIFVIIILIIEKIINRKNIESENKEEEKNINYKDLYIKKGNKDIKVNKNYLNTHEEMIAFVRGCFLVCGTISDPKKGSYHLEYVFDKEEDALFFNDLLHEMKFMSKIIKRKGKYVVYLKNSEEISDMIRMFEASNALFYFEDIRIYRDHKNMVNRLNNCDIANQEKSTNTGLKQIEIINYLKENRLHHSSRSHLYFHLPERKEAGFPPA